MPVLSRCLRSSSTRLGEICVCASSEVFPHNWFARRHYHTTPFHPSMQDPMHRSHDNLCPSVRTFIVSHDKSALGCLVAGPNRPAKWLDPPGRAYRIEMPTARDLLPSAMWNRTLRNASESRWLDSNPRPTATPIDLDALTAVPIPHRATAARQATRLWTPHDPFFSSASAMGIDVGLGVAPGPATLSIGGRKPGSDRGFGFCGVRLSLTGLHATWRHLRSIVVALAANDCPGRTPISAG